MHQRGIPSLDELLPTVSVSIHGRRSSGDAVGGPCLSTAAQLQLLLQAENAGVLERQVIALVWSHIQGLLASGAAEDIIK